MGSLRTRYATSFVTRKTLDVGQRSRRACASAKTRRVTRRIAWQIAPERESSRGVVTAVLLATGIVRPERWAVGALLVGLAMAQTACFNRQHVRYVVPYRENAERWSEIEPCLRECSELRGHQAKHCVGRCPGARTEAGSCDEVAACDAYCVAVPLHEPTRFTREVVTALGSAAGQAIIEATGTVAVGAAKAAAQGGPKKKKKKRGKAQPRRTPARPRPRRRPAVPHRI